MGEHQMQDAARAQEEFKSYVQEAAGSGTADELSKLADLKAKGVITDTEFQAQKAKLLT
jgi:Short C-terminal domain